MNRGKWLGGLVFALALVAPPAFASEPAELAENLLKGVVRGEAKSSFVRLLNHWGFTKFTPEERNELGDKLESTIADEGTPSRFEFAYSKKFGGSTLRLTYMTIHATKPVSWQFLFYRPKDEWRVIQLRINDDTDYLLE